MVLLDRARQRAHGARRHGLRRPAARRLVGDPRLRAARRAPAPARHRSERGERRRPDPRALGPHGDPRRLSRRPRLDPGGRARARPRGGGLAAGHDRRHAAPGHREPAGGGGAGPAARGARRAAARARDRADAHRRPHPRPPVRHRGDPRRPRGHRRRLDLPVPQQPVADRDRQRRRSGGEPAGDSRHAAPRRLTFPGGAGPRSAGRRLLPRGCPGDLPRRHDPRARAQRRTTRARPTPRPSATPRRTPEPRRHGHFQPRFLSLAPPHAVRSTWASSSAPP